MFTYTYAFIIFSFVSGFLTARKFGIDSPQYAACNVTTFVGGMVVQALSTH